MFRPELDLGTFGRAAIRLSLVAVLGVCSVTGARAQVLRTITIDGDLSDWADVLADPLQTALDGPAGGLLDRDAPVPTTGRDLTTFAWTYDSTHLYVLVGRVASASNIQRFWFYVDRDEDGLMEAGEPVLLVEWRGANRRTDTFLWSYSPVASGGDPLADPSGFADGWTMPGTITGSIALESAFGGEGSGTRMEARVSWSALGLGGPSPVMFHVSSSASTNLPSQIHDNMGGPGGSVGTTRIAGVRFAPDREGTTSSGGRIVFAHDVTNTGSLPDRCRLTASSTGDFAPTSVTFHIDTDGDGTLDPGEPPASDTDGDGVPDTGLLDSGETLALLLEIVAPPGLVDGSETIVTAIAASAANPAVFDSVTDRVTVATPGITLVKSVDRDEAAPGDPVRYTVVYTGGGSAPAHSVVVLDRVPSETSYAPGSATGPGTLIEFSTDGGATYGPAESEGVTHIRWIRLAPLAPGENGTVSFEVRVL